MFYISGKFYWQQTSTTRDIEGGLNQPLPGPRVKKTDYNVKIRDIEGKIPDVSNLVTKTALTTVENEIPSVCSLVKKNKQIMTLKLQKLKINLMIIIIINVLLLKSLML